MEPPGEVSIPQEHEEELCVLKSIFNEDFYPIIDKHNPITFDLILRFDTLSEAILLVHSESNASTRISHLPPITLRIIYKSTYPKVDAPNYCISGDYLTRDYLISLADRMDAMWIPGEVIVFIWAEFLKEQFVNKEYILPSVQSCSKIDERISSQYDTIGSARIYEQLIEYDREQNRIKFEQTLHTCPICLEDILGKDCVQFERCHHFACLSCLQAHANEHLTNAEMHRGSTIACPECNAPLYFSELRRILSDDKLLVKYQQRLFEQSVDMVWCPRCHHAIVYLPSESLSGNHPSFVECNYCQFTFCRRCQEVWHPQLRCPKDARIEQLVHMDGDSTRSVALSQTQAKNLLLEIQNVLTIETCSKPCPNCQVRIEKNGGCNHMSCRRCCVHFCWICGWWNPNSFGVHSCHPPELSTPSQVTLSSEMTESVQQVLTTNHQSDPVRHAIAQRVQTCPRSDCRQPNVKVGTRNMIICQKCNKSFCFLCGEPVFGEFHYSKYGCLLHTVVVN